MLISAALLYLVLSSIDLKDLQIIIMDFGVEYFILFSLVYTLTFFFRAIRWQTVATPIAKIRTVDAVKILFVSYFANNLIPACLGELVRVFLLVKKASVRFASSLATVLIDRMLDGMDYDALVRMEFGV